MSSEATTLGELLTNARRFDCEHFLYLPPDEVWNAATRCAVLPESDIDGTPDIAERLGLSYALQVAAIHDVVENANEQLPNPDTVRLLQAFLFYYDHDAYINFEA